MQRFRDVFCGGGGFSEAPRVFELLGGAAEMLAVSSEASSGSAVLVCSTFSSQIRASLFFPVEAATACFRAA